MNTFEKNFISVCWAGCRFVYIKGINLRFQVRNIRPVVDNCTGRPMVDNSQVL